MNNRGSVLFISILVIAAISVIAATVVFSRSVGLVKVGRSYRMQVENNQLVHELTVIFANPKLCEKLVTISGNTFGVGDIIKAPGTGGTPLKLKSNPSIGVSRMVLENPSTSDPAEGPVLQVAEFVIYTVDMGDLKNPIEKKNMVKAMYLPNGSGVKDCRLAVNAATACAELGFTWDSTKAHCQMCEKMGGAWGADNRCTLVGGGQ